ncbi:MAG: holo-ACP synthase [Micavibrio sp.]
MIIGTGADILDCTRLGRVLEQFGERFIKRCFTDGERAKAERRREASTHIATYAKRFAAKEACSKALGTGFSHGVFMKDIGVVNDAAGKPELVLTGGALARLRSMVPAGMEPRLHLTLTDEPPIVYAHVVIEAVVPAG